MKTKILIIACFILNTFANAQNKDALFLVNESQKKIFCNSGQSANKAWYTIYEKSKDTVLEKTTIIDKSRFIPVTDSLQKAGFAPKFKKQKVSDAVVTLKMIEHKFHKTDTVKKAGGKFTVDSIFTVKIMANIKSEKEKINKSRIYSQKYTTVNKAKLGEKIKKYKDFSLIKYSNAEIFESELLFSKLLLITPESYFGSFDPTEKEFL